jgi:hypothetical protein
MAVECGDFKGALKRNPFDPRRDRSAARASAASNAPYFASLSKYLPHQGKRFRSWNLLERSLEEVRRRTKVIGRFPGKTSCLSLCWAMLDILIAGARGLGFSDVEYRQVVQQRIGRAQPDRAAAKIA